MSNSTNGIQSCSLAADSADAKGLKTLAYCSVMMTAVFGNFFILFIIFETKSMRNTINYFVANMALSDLFLVMFAYPRLITEVFWGPQRWIVEGSFGLVLCKLDFLLTDVSLAVSIQSLVLIAVDRFNAVMFPLRPPLFSSKVRRIVIPCTWLVATGLHFPYLLAFRLQETLDGVFCVRDWKQAFGASSSLRNYYVSLFIILALVPFSLIVVFYTVIIITLKHHKFPGQQSVNSREIQIRIKRDRSVLKLAIATVVGFALCWAPLNVYAFMLFFVQEPSLGCGSRLFYFVSFFLAYSNSAINPCLCFMFSKKYRIAFKHLFRRLWCKCNFQRVRPELVVQQPCEIMLN